MPAPRIICHGGAGTLKPNHHERQRAVEEAAAEGFKILEKGGSALDAVEAAVAYMEDTPCLNAGTGSFVQMDGMCRMDAAIMDSNLNLGAVIQISFVKNPIKVARRVMETGVHSILMGDLATEFARNQGFPRFDTRTREKLEIWLDLRERMQGASTYEMVLELKKEQLRNSHSLTGTVGAVAMDTEGLIVAGSSTGGLRIDMPGRVGDTPLPGCGTYACGEGGVACTGNGERIMKAVLGHEVISLLRYGLSAQEAVERALEIIRLSGGRAGIIAIDKKGRIGKSFDTESMEHFEITG